MHSSLFLSPSASPSSNTMYTYIKLHTLTVHTCSSPSEAQRWIDKHTLSTGYIKVLYQGSYNDVLPSELTLIDEAEHTHTQEHTNLSSHPRCITCGTTTYDVIHTHHDHWIGQYTCGHHTMGYMHTGAKVQDCLHCGGSECTPNGDTCSYCKGLWS